MTHAKCAAILVSALVLTGCTQTQLDKLSASLDRFDQAVERIDSSIARVSPALWQKCQNAQGVGTQLQPLAAKANRTAGAGLAIVNDALRAGCQAPPPTDIQGAITSLVAAATAGYNAYLQAKAGG